MNVIRAATILLMVFSIVAAIGVARPALWQHNTRPAGLGAPAGQIVRPAAAAANSTALERAFAKRDNALAGAAKSARLYASDREPIQDIAVTAGRVQAPEESRRRHGSRMF
jgi:hypothetical protein